MKKKNFFDMQEKPAFVSMIDYDTNIVVNGYILKVDFNNQNTSIINSKKGGEENMIKTIRKAKKGWEELYDKVMAKKENHEASKVEAIEDVKNTLNLLASKYNITFDIDNIISKVEEKFLIASEEIENVLLQVSFEEEIEVPEENEIAILEEVDVDKANQENI